MMDLGLEHINWDAVDESLAGADMLSADAANPDSPTAPPPNPFSFTAPNAAAPSLNLAAGLEVVPFTAAEPELVFAKGADARPFPLHALGPLASVVDVVARKTQAPAAIAAGSALGVVSLAVQGHADVQTMAGSAPVSLFVLTIAKSGERKSACDKMLGWAINRHEREQDAEYRQAMSKYIAHDAAHTQIANRAKAAIRAGEAGAEAMEKVGPAPRKPLLPDRAMTEPTFEGMTKLYAEGNPSQAILSDEGGQFLGGHAMNAENRQKTLTAISKLWDGGAIKRTRGGDGSMTLRGRRLSLHLMVQPVVASGLLSDPLAIGQGFLPRMLICQPESNIGFREVDVCGAADELSSNDSCTLHEYETRILDILRRPMPALGCNGDEQGQELSLRTLPLSREAREALGMFAQKIERAQAPGCVLSNLTGTASKIAEQACRIAAALTLYTNLDAHEVPQATMRGAIELASWYLSEAMRLTGAAAVSREEQEADELRRWICERWATLAAANKLDPQHLIPSYVTSYGPAPMRSTAKAKAALAELARLGWLVKLEPNSIVDGKPRRLAYRIADG